ncbi:MAG TPA: TlpA disulfide reductase family protein [Acidiferrobacterales bacterium]
MTRNHAIVRTLLLAAALSLPATPAGADGADRIPHVNERGRAGYAEFLAAETHRAFAIAPGGAWAWRSGLDSGEQAAAAAVAACQEHSAQRCVVYAIDDRVVLDRQRWPTLWRPYASAAQAAEAPSGQRRGERFPDLRLTGPDAKPLALSDLRGKAVVLHLWGSWCPPCVHELPQLEKLTRRFANTPGLAFVFAQVREPYADARGWLERHDLRLPLYDSGSRGPQDDRLRLRDGATLVDRALAPVFPATYVLDRHGIVVFSIHGSPDDWSEYDAFLRNLVAHSK